MKLLLDSHTLIWAADHPAKLTAVVQALIQNPSHDRLISVASLSSPNPYEWRLANPNRYEPDCWARVS